ncbi:MAG: biotin-dependent carboxyltransferase family protein [Candidatus Pelagibacter sp.]
MAKNFFKIIRAGINSTFQDLGRDNLYHIGIPFSGAMDNRNYLLSNRLVQNDLNTPVLEFAYQGPLLKYQGKKINIAITGDVKFNLKKGQKIFEGNCYQTYLIENDDEIDILSTNKSVYGYLSVNAKFDLKFQWESCSINTKANIGSNNGRKIFDGQEINLKEINDDYTKKKLDYFNSKIEKIRIIKGTNYDYFSEKGKKIFFNKEFKVSKLSDRMGMRLEGEKIENIVDTNIKSEGLLKGVVQIPADGNPIIMLSDHGTIGGYPKIGVVISADYDKLVQLPPGSKIRFQEIELSDAETLFKLYEMETQNLISQIK